MSKDASTDSNTDIPEGYQLLPEDGSFHDRLQPVYYRMEGDSLTFALNVQAHHCNPGGICHGAVFMAMMDLCMGGAISMRLKAFSMTPTMNMQLNYLTLAKQGDWLIAEGSVLKLTNTVAFAEGKISRGNDVINQATGTFKLPRQTT